MVRRSQEYFIDVQQNLETLNHDLSVETEDHGPEQTGTTRRYGSLPTGSHHTTGSLLMPARTSKDYKEAPSRNKDYHQG